MYCSHEMPFGAAVSPGQGVHFRLWAPDATRVELVTVGEHQVSLPMQRGAEGWYHCLTEQAQAGSLYRFCINGSQSVPDPASRFQPEDVHGWSQVIDPRQWRWDDAAWHGRPWEEAVIYEIHVGTFTQEGTFAAIKKHLDYLVDLGITAIELMPVADFPGRRNWGYDGALLFAPDSQYGTPDELKGFIQAAHHKGLMVFLDVVYNHFGPEGNYIGLYAPQFFTEKHHTPWGAAINFGDNNSRIVRDFFIHNALFWLTEYRFDGLRFDAAHAIVDESSPPILEELALRVHDAIGPQRRVHLMLENDDNIAHYLRRDEKRKPYCYAAQWNDDIHHAIHVLITDETHGYYMDYAHQPIKQLARGLSEGFVYQGERSAYRGLKRGQPSKFLPPSAFINFLQNHDQIGNRALGERINMLASPAAIKAAMAILLLAPNPPLLFMGQEWGCTQPFPFFCDFGPDLADKVTVGRRNEFAGFPEFVDPHRRESIPDPNADSTFSSAVLEHPSETNVDAQQWLSFYRSLLQLRRRTIIPLLVNKACASAEYKIFSGSGLAVFWKFGEAQLMLLANLHHQHAKGAPTPYRHLIYASSEGSHVGDSTHLPPWFVGWSITAQSVA